METNASDWPEKPYRWMVEDAQKGIDAGANYLVALGLFCYTEIMGRDVLKYQNPDTKYFPNRDCFRVFLGEYMGYTDLLEKHGDNLYDWFRNGTAHGYSVKEAIPSSGVFERVDPLAEAKLSEMGYDASKGLIVLTQSRGLEDNVPIQGFVVLRTYLNDFSRGIQKYLEESEQLIV